MDPMTLAEFYARIALADNGVKITRKDGVGPVRVITEMPYGYLEVPENGTFVELGEKYTVEHLMASLSLKWAIVSGNVEVFTSDVVISRMSPAIV